MFYRKWFYKKTHKFLPLSFVFLVMAQTDTKQIKKQMDAALKDGVYDRYVVLFGQYMSQPDKDEEYYKTITMLYYLATENFPQYYLYAQGCLNHMDKYAYVFEMYNIIRTCNLHMIENCLKNAEKVHKALLLKIKENIEKAFEKRENQIVTKNNCKMDKDNVQHIKDCCYIIKQFKR